ncbi:MAG: hypothetical protein U9R75_11940 [Candidatus Thermoplasmatota archaeon]|nr:hypothetical protein [Candidatus Thermoplasmatota archaeon]
MNEKYTLSHLEQMIMSLIGSKNIITMKEIYDLFPQNSKATLRNTASTSRRISGFPKTLTLISSEI